MGDERRRRAEALTKYGIARTEFDAERIEPLLRFGRAFADPMRIRLMVLLAERSMYGQELADALEVSAPTISHHLASLKGAGLIRTRRENSYHYYELDPSGLEKIAASLTLEHLHSIGTSFPTQESDPLPPEEDRRMIQWAYFDEAGHLRRIPSGEPARRFIMERIAVSFVWGHIYSEAEVDEILKGIHEESATLRRALIDQKLMICEHGRYWLARPQ